MGGAQLAVDCRGCKHGPNTEDDPCTHPRHGKMAKVDTPCPLYAYHAQKEVKSFIKSCTSCGRDLPSSKFDFLDELDGKICKNCMTYYRSATKKEQTRLRDGR
jgi:hypothetical protein